MNDQRIPLQLPSYFSNLTNVGKTLTANFRNIGKMLVLNIDPVFCEVDFTTLYNCTTMHYYHCRKLNQQTVGMFHLALCWSCDGPRHVGCNDCNYPISLHFTSEWYQLRFVCLCRLH